MLIADSWKDYEIIDTSAGEKLERWGKYILLRPDPQVIWDTPKGDPRWRALSAHYLRSKSGGGSWEIFDLPDQWKISYPLYDEKLIFNLKPFSFKHTGLFPEQAVNWDWAYSIINKEVSAGRKVKVLNLFAYTGGATAACAKAGAHVTHVDSSKGMIAWAKENMAASKIPPERLRWICEDCRKFTEREIRRGNKYDAVIMDPPSYGRGSKGEVWKLEDNIFDLIKLTSELLCDEPLFFLINSYTTGLQPGVLNYMLNAVLAERFGGTAFADEIGLPVSSNSLILPCGAAGRWQRGDL